MNFSNDHAQGAHYWICPDRKRWQEERFSIFAENVRILGRFPDVIYIALIWRFEILGFSSLPKIFKIWNFRSFFALDLRSGPRPCWSWWWKYSESSNCIYNSHNSNKLPDPGKSRNSRNNRKYTNCIWNIDSLPDLL